MGHLGPERVFQLARERKRAFCQDIEEEISHHLERVCYYVKKKPPHWKHVDLLSTITTTVRNNSHWHLSS